MKHLIRFVAAIGAATPVAGCGGSQPLTGAPPAMSQAQAAVVRADRGTSWMLPEAKSVRELLYASDGSDIYVYDYRSGKQVGVLEGFDGAGGMCVDAQGYVYIANYYSGETIEYAHGGAKPLKTFTTTNGYAVGCSVDSHGDLAVTDNAVDRGPHTTAGPGQVCIWKRRRGAATCYREPWFDDNDKCFYMSPAGYDNAGNLFVEGEDRNRISTWVCALLKHPATNRPTMVTLSFDVTINAPSNVMWDGRYITLSDSAPGEGAYGIYQAALSGTTLTKVGQTILSSPCYSSGSGYSYGTGGAFIVGKKNTPINARQGSTVIQPNVCASNTLISFWHYPVGGESYKRLATIFAEAVVVSVRP